MDMVEHVQTNQDIYAPRSHHVVSIDYFQQSRMSSSLTLSRSVPTLGSRQVENEPVS